MSYNVYLCGHVDEIDEPWEWRDKIKNNWKDDPELEFTDPVEKFPEYDDNESEVVWWCITQAIISDGLFVRWDNETLTVGTIAEIFAAFLFHTPAVIYYKGDPSDVSPFLEELTQFIYNDEDAAMLSLKHEIKSHRTPTW